MAKKDKIERALAVKQEFDVVADDWSKELIKSLNKELGTRVAYNLSVDEAPTEVKRWISTGSRLLDYIIAGKRNGGAPEGRIVEISGAPSIGKSHIAFQMCRTVQSMGGLAVYIDTENAVPLEKLKHMGVDVAHRFVYCDSHCTEEVFQIMESTITKAKAIVDKNVPILIVWDSVAATSPKAELEGDYDKDTIGLQARVLAKGFRKITGVIGQNNITLVCLNQIKTKIGVMYGDPWTCPGGQSLPFHASVRLRLMGGTHVKNAHGTTIGINVNATVSKNKVSIPFRKATFSIIFGKGIDEGEHLFDLVRTHCDKNGPVQIGQSNDKVALIEGTGAWKTLRVVKVEDSSVLVEKKFTKNQFNELLTSQEYGSYVEDLIEKTMSVNMETVDTYSVDPETGEVVDPQTDGLDEQEEAQ